MGAALSFLIKVGPASIRAGGRVEGATVPDVAKAAARMAADSITRHRVVGPGKLLSLFVGGAVVATGTTIGIEEGQKIVDEGKKKVEEEKKKIEENKKKAEEGLRKIDEDTKKLQAEIADKKKIQELQDELDTAKRMSAEDKKTIEAQQKKIDEDTKIVEDYEKTVEGEMKKAEEEAKNAPIHAKPIEMKRAVVPHYVLVTMDDPGVLSRPDVHWSGGHMDHCDQETGVATWLYDGVDGVNVTGACSYAESGVRWSLGGHGLFDGYVPSNTTGSVRVSGTWTAGEGEHRKIWPNPTPAQRILQFQVLAAGIRTDLVKV